MYQWQLLKLLLLPSALSGLTVFGASIGFLGYFAWQYIQDSQFFYDYLFGAYGFQSYAWNPLTRGAEFLGGSIAYYVLLVLFALCVGAAIYSILEGISRFRQSYINMAQELHNTGASRDDAVAELITRICLRVMGLLGWGLYMVFFGGVLTQFALLLVELGIQGLQAGESWKASYCLLAIIELTLALHVHLLFARLCLLRARLFGGDRQVAAVEAGPGPYQYPSV